MINDLKLATSNHLSPYLIILITTLLIALAFTRVRKVAQTLLAPTLALVSTPLAIIFIIYITLQLSKSRENNIKIPRAAKALLASSTVLMGIYLSLNSYSQAENNVSVDCSSNDKARCLGFIISKTISTKGLEKGLDDLNNYNLDIDQCHDVTHWAGRFAVSTLPTEKLLKGLKMHCQLGYLHGVAEQLGQTAEESEWLKFIASCDEQPTDVLQDFCGHGVGHAALMRAGGDLKNAFQQCRSITDNEALKGCQAAAPMEKANIWANTDGNQDTFVNILNECNTLNKDDKIQCLTNIWRGSLDGQKLNLFELAQICENHPLDIAKQCARGFGVGFGGYPDIISMKQDQVPCRSIKNNDVKLSCLEGYAWAASYKAYKSGYSAKEVCNVLNFEECNTILNKYLRDFKQNKDLFNNS